MTDTAPDLEPGEKVLAEWRADRAQYWRAHAIMAGLAAAAGGVFFWATGANAGGVLGGVLGGLLAITVRGAYLADEQFRSVWRLTDRRVIQPAGGTLGLLEIETARLILGDLQLITRTGDKHLVKHLADAPAALGALTAARDKRQRRAARDR
jgi:hypothetical protein